MTWEPVKTLPRDELSFLEARWHRKGCRMGDALRTSVGIECEHGFDVCPTCDPCDCKDAKVAQT